jgi:DNA-directed RNA polymerase subunit RPC12/RpoP
MKKRCAICNKNIKEENGKLQGTLIRVRDETGKRKFVYVCSECEKTKDYIERAVVRDA